jgi:predicted N-acetyltransferase YhbS
VYHLENGELVLKPEHYDMTGWPPGEAGEYGPILLDCFDRGGTFVGAFDDAGTMVAVSVLESRFIGKKEDQLQLTFLHVSRTHRGKGLGSKLFALSVARAQAFGAHKLYISSTPAQNTVDFYMNLGCRLAGEIDPDLYELEPEDIHLEYAIA